MAIKVLNAHVEWKGGSVAEGTARGFKVTVDEPVEQGGTNTSMNPLEMLLCALGGCLTLMVNAFARKFRVEVKSLSIELEGDFDSDGLTGRNPDARKGFSDIRYKMHIVSDSPEENISKLYEYIEKHCPVRDTLRGVNVSGEYVVEK